MKIVIRDMKKEDWKSVADIYQEGIDTQIATFQTEVPEYEAWDQSHIKECRLVAETNEEIVGWTALSPVSSRCVYKGVAEVSIYIKREHRGNRIGEMLLQRLFIESEREGYWTLQSGIIELNKASIALHTKSGFRMVGYREKIAKDRQGNWQNTVLMERRSEVIS